MRPDLDDFDEEIRGHMALSVKERIECGEDPEAARLAAPRVTTISSFGDFSTAELTIIGLGGEPRRSRRPRGRS